MPISASVRERETKIATEALYATSTERRNLEVEVFNGIVQKANECV